MDRTKDFFPRTWEEVCKDPFLANLPYRVEINQQGNIELSPHSRFHSKYQKVIEKLLDRLMTGGEAFVEYAIQAENSTPVADVIWTSHERDAAEKGEFACETAPEICVEVRSPSNSSHEMQEKRREYFAAGALEVWHCNLTGGMTFFGIEGELERSRLCPQFPVQVKI